MPGTVINGASIAYEVLGEKGAWIALSPGGRASLAAVREQAEKVAARGFRVLIHDRRNCGLSDIGFTLADSEFGMWAEDMHSLLQELGALPIVAGGTSSGARLALTLALRYPKSVRALLLWRLTGGVFAADRLAQHYYGQYIDAAIAGGMAKVLDTDHFKELANAKPANRAKLLAMDTDDFIGQMRYWRRFFVDGRDEVLIGCGASALQTIKIPVCVIPGNDRTHSGPAAREAQRHLPNSELHDITPQELDTDFIPVEEWADPEDVADIFARFLTDKKIAS